MISTKQLAQRLARKMWGVDFAHLTMSTAEELRDGINKTLLEFASKLPAARKSREVPFVVDGPQSVTATLTSGSTALILSPIPLGFYTSAADLVGRGIVFNGLPVLNRLVSATKLARPWLLTGGSVQAIVFGDGIPLPSRMEQLVDGVSWQSASDSTAIPLPPRDESLPISTPLQVGQPSFWWLEPFGNADAVECSLILRLWPLPGAAGEILTKVKLWADPVTIPDLNVTTRSLPIFEEELGLFIDLAAEHLLSAGDINPKLDATAIRTSAMTARTLLDMRKQPNPSAVPNRVFTPHNW